MIRRQRLADRKISRLAILCGLICVHVLTAEGRGQDPVPAPADWDSGMDLFCSMLQSQGLRAKDLKRTDSQTLALDRFFAAPERSAVILTGYVEPSRFEGIRAYLNAGGMLLLATDQTTRLENLCIVRGGRVRDSQNRQGFRDCLLLRPRLSDHSLMQGVDTVLTNQSGWISVLNRFPSVRWTVPIRLPQSAIPGASQGSPLLATADVGDFPSGRLIVLADDSLLTNGMLWHANNKTLGLNLVNELASQKRNTMLFLRNGRPVRSRVGDLLLQQAAQMDLPPETIPPEALWDLPGDALLDIGNQLLIDIEDSNVINDALTNRPRFLSSRSYRRALLLLIGSLALLIFLYRAWRRNQPLLSWKRPRRALPPPASASVVPLEHAAAALARDACRRLTGSDDVVEWQRELSAQGPGWQKLVDASESPRMTKQALADVLQQAAAQNPVSLTKAQLERFGQQVYDLRFLRT